MPTSHFDRRTPKVTCYFWHMGNCSKSAENCVFAHYNTGVVAEPPTIDPRKQDRLRNRKSDRSVAAKTERSSNDGRIERDSRETRYDSYRHENIYHGDHRYAHNPRDHPATEARLRSAEHAIEQREYALRIHEVAFKAREDSLRSREENMQMRESTLGALQDEMLRKLEEGYIQVTSTIEQFHEEIDMAQRTLINRREQVLEHENITDIWRNVHGIARYRGSLSIDAVLGAIGMLKDSLCDAHMSLTNYVHRAVTKPTAIHQSATDQEPVETQGRAHVNDGQMDS